MTNSNMSQSVENLQTALSMELTAVNQYLLHANVLEDWGLDRLADKMREEINDELGHADRFIERILYLDGVPKVVPAKAPVQAKTLEEMLTSDLVEERSAVRFYTQAVEAAANDNDIGTRRLFEDIVMDEEGHADWLSRQIGLLKKMGEPHYMLSQMEERPAA